MGNRYFQQKEQRKGTAEEVRQNQRKRFFIFVFSVSICVHLRHLRLIFFLLCGSAMDAGAYNCNSPAIVVQCEPYLCKAPYSSHSSLPLCGALWITSPPMPNSPVWPM